MSFEFESILFFRSVLILKSRCFYQLAQFQNILFLSVCRCICGHSQEQRSTGAALYSFSTVLQVINCKTFYSKQTIIINCLLQGVFKNNFFFSVLNSNNRLYYEQKSLKITHTPIHTESLENKSKRLNTKKWKSA